MQTEVMELEKMLEQEIEEYSKLESYIVEKKNVLIKGNIDKLRYIDNEIEKFNSKMRNIEKRRIEVSKKFGNENLSLKEIVKRIDDEKASERISGSRKKLNDILNNVKVQNNINAELIRHGLKLIESSIHMITDVFDPESAAYNNYGKAKKANLTISSVIEEA